MFVRYTHLGVGHPIIPRKIIRDSESAIVSTNNMDIDDDGDYEEDDGNSDDESDGGRDEGEDEFSDEELEDGDECDDECSDGELEDDEERDDDENAFGDPLSF